MHFLQIGRADVACLLGGTWIVYYAVSRLLRRSGGATTPLRGPPTTSWLWGVSKFLAASGNHAQVYEQWANQYGHVYRVPDVLGTSRVVLCDPKAVAQFYSKGTFTYVHTTLARIVIEAFFGRGLLIAEGESHRRQRKALTPAFSNAAVRKLMNVFFDSAYKCKSVWDGMIDSNTEGAVIDVQQWMNNIALDSIGIAGFSHNFGQLDGLESDVSVAFNALGGDDRSISTAFIILLSPYLPFLLALPTKRNRAIRRLRQSLREISSALLRRTREASEGIAEEKSIIGLLIKGENSESQLALTQEEVLSQMTVLLLAGYETVSIALTWALIELCRFPEKQRNLRDELLSQFPSSDPTWDQLMSSLPYLDAVVHEALRLHPPLPSTTRAVAEDDLLPLSTPIVTSSGEAVSSVFIAKGTTTFVPIRFMNQAEWLCGPDAQEFRPERWLEPNFGEKNEVQGHRRLLSFIDGPRACLGKNFALIEFKAVLSVIIRNFTFEFQGPEPKIESHLSLLPRPRLAGEDGARVPLRVRRVE